ncbi:IS200/IS605 family accessory protein TnpB-related protein [Actinomadura sp. NPDC048394]|jgi:hypothetical protein|uniref:IS200/IS605 family accessory protein TnpB-related protein n=1 Tax=Actinomadura sp. NPDC048394 TaxID=3158223 RepID=UPI0033F3BA3A
MSQSVAEGGVSSGGGAGSRVGSFSPPFVAAGPSGVAVRDRLKGLTEQDERVLRLVGAHLGSLCARDLKARCADGLEHGPDGWAARKRKLTAGSSARWAGSITKATNDQWALARRGHLAHLRSLEAGMRTLEHRLSLPIGAKGSEGSPGGYRTRREWFAKSRRLALMRERLVAARADWDAGIVRVVRGGRKLLTSRHHLDKAGLTEDEWRQRWQASRWFLQADGESGKRYGNETIRVTPAGEVSIRLPGPLAHLANAPHSRYVLTARVAFQHRGAEWADRVEGNRAVAYRIHLDIGRGRWYLTASWRRAAVSGIPLETARARGIVGVDTNADHFAAWRLDRHGNPVGRPRRFDYDLSGAAPHRDAQVRHAITRLLHWAASCGVAAIGIEDLDFTAERTREKYGRRARFRQLVSGMPTGKLKARLAAMAAEVGLAIVAVDPAYTTKWGVQHWREPMGTPHRKVSRHDAASIAVGRRALGHPVRRRTAPPRHHQSDDAGYRTVQADRGDRRRERSRHPVTEPAHDACPRTRAMRKRETSASNTVRDARSSGRRARSPLPDTV